MTDDELPEAITLVPQPTRDRLNHRQLRDYQLHRWQYLTWCLHEGKDVEERID